MSNSSAFYQHYLKEIWRNREFPSSVYDRYNTVTKVLDKILGSRHDRTRTFRKKQKRYI